MEEAQDVGLVLRELRERAGLSQRAFALQLGVQQPAVARWEAGRVRLPINRIEQILEPLGYGIEYNLRAIPISEALISGVPLKLVRRASSSNPNDTRSRTVTSGANIFEVNPDVPWNVEMRDRKTGEPLPGATVYPFGVDDMVWHPDGVLIRYGRTVGKIVSVGKSDDQGHAAFSFMHADRRDLELADVIDIDAWRSRLGEVDSQCDNDSVPSHQGG